MLVQNTGLISVSPLLEHAFVYPSNLLSVSWTGNENFLRVLMQNGNLSERDANDLTPLHLAVWNMHEDVVRVLLDANPLWIMAPDRNGPTAANLAVWNGDIRAVGLLLRTAEHISTQLFESLMQI